MYKRKIVTLLLSVIFALNGLIVACSAPNKDDGGEVTKGLNATFIDVGEGDAIFVTLPDGKAVLIDCGKTASSVYKKVRGVLAKFSITKIDYFILTHPDIDHIGNALNIIEDYEVGKVFLPDVWDSAPFELFHQIKSSLVENEIPYEISLSYKTIIGEDYGLAFLTPKPFEVNGSSYADFNSCQQNYTDEIVNNISPIIYLEYKGIRFLFTGDAGVSQEQLVVDEYFSNIYDSAIRGMTVELEEIDVLKVSHHGSKDGSSANFLGLLRPKNAVISVGGNNIYGHPSIYTLNRLYACNDSIEIYTTYQMGSVNFAVNEIGKLTIQTQF